MARDDDIDDQVRKDWEFTRRAQELMSRLRKDGKPEPSPGDEAAREEETTREDDNKPDE